MFSSSRRLTLLDHFRTPHDVDAESASATIEQLESSARGSKLFWIGDSIQAPAVAATVLSADRELHVPLFARVLPDRAAESLLAEQGGNWSRARVLAGSEGDELGSIWRRADGSVFLPFDPDEVLLNYWSERYATIGGGSRAGELRRRLMVGYYRLRPLLPRPLQIWLRRRFARVQARSRFPHWPVETCLHDFCDLMYSILASIAGEPVPCIASWPDDCTWALVLTHDVEHAEGWAAREAVVELELAHGVRSSWNLVPRRYEVDLAQVEELVARGFEIGVHGLEHDGRDLESFATWQARLPGIRSAAARWGAVGFRSPALHRAWDWMPLLGLDYDSSCPDTDPFEPQAGGCCTWLPFFNREMVELPVTLAQDHTLFVILRELDEATWLEKASFLRARGGLALIDTHPDYLVDGEIFSAYSCFLDAFASDQSAWRALPRDVSAWWRRRASSSLQRHQGHWQVVGPAADEARVEFLGGSW
jgi:hypothetical protein